MSAHSATSADLCASFFPGHRIHPIHQRHLGDQLDWADVDVHIEADLGLVQLCHGDRLQLMWTHAGEQIVQAAADAGGSGQWCQRYTTLLLPGAYAGTARRSFFYLSPVGTARPCVVPTQSSPTG